MNWQHAGINALATPREPGYDRESASAMTSARRHDAGCHGLCRARNKLMEHFTYDSWTRRSARDGRIDRRLRCQLARLLRSKTGYKRRADPPLMDRSGQVEMSHFAKQINTGCAPLYRGDAPVRVRRCRTSATFRPVGRRLMGRLPQPQRAEILGPLHSDTADLPRCSSRRVAVIELTGYAGSLLCSAGRSCSAY
jgi:hypothetical protein